MPQMDIADQALNFINACISKKADHTKSRLNLPQKGRG